MVKKYKINYKGTEIEIEQLENGKLRKPNIVKELSGSFGGMQVKPSVEIILVVMKPLSVKTYVDQAMKRLEEEEVILKEIEKENNIEIER